MKIFFLSIVILNAVCGNEEDFIVHSVCGSEDDFRIIDAIIQESPCTEAGGICTVAEDCPKGHLAERQGLCPTQRKQGIDCCYGVSTKETRCYKHGGVCMKPEEFCNPSLIFDGATDCVDRKCCIMTL